MTILKKIKLLEGYGNISEDKSSKKPLLNIICLTSSKKLESGFDKAV